MAMWRCERCGTPQAEATRCWVCSRSAVSCSTCRNFRRSIAGRLGYCALDRARLPLQGDEVHACWQAPLSATADDQGLFATRARALASSDHSRPSGPVVPRSAARVERRPDAGWTPGRRRVGVPVLADGAVSGQAGARAEGRLVEAPIVRPSRSIVLEPVIEPSAELEGHRLPHGRSVA